MAIVSEGVQKVIINGVAEVDHSMATATDARVLNGATYFDAKGDLREGECDFDMNTSGMNITEDAVLTGYSGGAKGSVVQGRMPNAGSKVLKIRNKTDRLTIAKGFHDGTGYVTLDAEAQAELLPEVIPEGVTIMGVEGTRKDAENISAQAKSVTPSFSTQVVKPDTGFSHLTQVTVAAIPVQRTTGTDGAVRITVG